MLGEKRKAESEKRMQVGRRESIAESTRASADPLVRHSLDEVRVFDVGYGFGFGLRTDEINNYLTRRPNRVHLLGDM